MILIFVEMMGLIGMGNVHIKRTILSEGKIFVTNISFLRKNLSMFIKNVIECNESIMINTEKRNAVILSEDEYNAMRETIFLTS